MGPLYRTSPFQDTIQQNSSFVVCSNQNESILLPIYQRRDRKPSQQMGSGKGTESGNSRLLFLDLPSSKKERKVTFDNRPFFIEPIHRETVFQNRDSQVGKTSDEAVSIDLTDAYLHVPIDHQSWKYLRFVYEDQVFHFTALLFGMSLSPLIFSKRMDVIAAFLRQCAISVFPYLDDWLIKDLIRNRLISQTRFCIQNIQSLGFLLNLKKSDLLPSQKFTFIGMEFLTQQDLVRVPTDRVQALLLTIKKFLSFKHVSAQTFFSLLATQCYSRFCSLRQTLLTSPSDVSSVCLEISYSSSQSSSYDQRYDLISLTMVDEHESIRNRNFYPSYRSQNFP